MKLYGSLASPFVRRIRLLLVEQDYTFEEIDIFSEIGRKILTDNNPAKKVPVLVDGDITLYDSRVIYRYLAEKYQLPPLSWQQENELTLIDAVNDSLVSLLICKRSDFDVDSDKLFFNLQHERIEAVFTQLEDMVAKGEFMRWRYPAICLFCLLDWCEFRDLYDWQKWPSLSAWFHKNNHHEGISASDPR